MASVSLSLTLSLSTRVEVGLPYGCTHVDDRLMSALQYATKMILKKGIFEDKNSYGGHLVFQNENLTLFIS